MPLNQQVILPSMLFALAAFVAVACGGSTSARDESRIRTAVAGALSSSADSTELKQILESFNDGQGMCWAIDIAQNELARQLGLQVLAGTLSQQRVNQVRAVLSALRFAFDCHDPFATDGGVQDGSAADGSIRCDSPLGTCPPGSACHPDGTCVANVLPDGGMQNCHQPGFLCPPAMICSASGTCVVDSDGGYDCNAPGAMCPAGLACMPDGSCSSNDGGTFNCRAPGAMCPAGLSCMPDGSCSANDAGVSDAGVSDTGVDGTVIDLGTLAGGTIPSGTESASVTDADYAPFLADQLVGRLRGSGTTANLADDSALASCGADRPFNSDFVINLTLTAARRVVLDTSTSLYGAGHIQEDTVLTLSRLAGPQAMELACDDDGGDGNASRIDRVLPAGQYQFRIAGYAARTVSFDATLLLYPN